MCERLQRSGRSGTPGGTGRTGGTGRRGRQRRQRRTGPVTAAERAAYEKNPFALTDIVYFETSNYCPLSRVHKFCPSHVRRGAPAHLPRRIIEAALRSLGRYGYGRDIRFHTMNEPLADPRLFELVRLTRKRAPQASVTIFTSGVSLSQTLLDELIEAGMTTLLLTAYNETDRDRLSSLRIDCPSHLFYRPGFNDPTLLGRYEAEALDLGEPCAAPLRRLQIGCDGLLALCCRDWKRQHTYGSLAEKRLEELVWQSAVWDIYASLRSGERSLGLCRRCDRWR